MQMTLFMIFPSLLPMFRSSENWVSAWHDHSLTRNFRGGDEVSLFSCPHFRSRAQLASSVHRPIFLTIRSADAAAARLSSVKELSYVVSDVLLAAAAAEHEGDHDDGGHGGADDDVREEEGNS